MLVDLPLWAEFGIVGISAAIVIAILKVVFGYLSTRQEKKDEIRAKLQDALLEEFRNGRTEIVSNLKNMDVTLNTCQVDIASVKSTVTAQSQRIEEIVTDVREIESRLRDVEFHKVIVESDSKISQGGLR